jgi:hypothetical protein
MLKITKAMFISFAIAVLSGCAAAPAQKEAMVTHTVTDAKDIKAEFKEKFAVIKVSGGESTNPFWKSKVNSEAFGAALKESLVEAGLAGKNLADSPYKIDANLETLDQPSFGLTYTVKSTVKYKVYNDSFNKEFPITADGVATTSDSILGITRLKIANEKSIQANIAEFIRQLSLSDIK